MMTEETLKTIERLSQNGWQADAETVLTLVTEIERLRAELAQRDAENAALREDMADTRSALASAELIIKTGIRTSKDKDYYEYLEARGHALSLNVTPHIADATPVETAPAPEPAPEIKKGDKVGVIRAHGHGDKKLIGLEGVVTEVREGEELTYRYTVKIGERRYSLARDQIIPLSAD